ncbi:phosphatase 2C-like domain-containing protein [Ochromonadaceae sp. CCMP2298]|nr:phosphatase 2C-like domain-containing protein [Ochromonadaceae sp. CCMP2298]|mmetsp:Transcript_30079/g.66572  ORF Transcript_30079/g.66572 Transcript_30079/m.66572 type:complete len:318 (+) Transcript_30079:108-1061(+)
MGSFLQFSELIWYTVPYLVLLTITFVSVRFMATYMTKALEFFLNQPVKVNPFVNGVRYPVSYWTEKGGRPYQEDRHHELRGRGAADSSLYGVFDGHGGSRAAQYTKDYLLKSIVTDVEFEESPSKAMFRSFFKVDSEFSAKARLQMLTDGTTSTVAIIHDGRIFVGNAGDSRAVLVQKGGKVMPMSIDHRPDRTDEAERIRKLGGSVVHWGRWRVEGILAVSRSIGDVTLQPYITCEPEIMEKQIENEDEYLVLASDGVFDTMTNEDVAKIVLRNGKDFLNVSKRVCTEAIIMGSTDNVTALVIDLKQRLRTVEQKR